MIGGEFQRILELNCCGKIEIQTQSLPGGPEEDTRKDVLSLVGVLAEIRTQHLTNISPHRCRYASPLDNGPLWRN
jgi:hypothetical protein